MLPFDYDHLPLAAKAEFDRLKETGVRLVEKVNELSDQRCKLVLAVLSDCGTVPDVEEFIADQFGGDWNRAVDFAVHCIRINRDPTRTEAFKSSPRGTAGRQCLPSAPTGYNRTRIMTVRPVFN